MHHTLLQYVGPAVMQAFRSLKLMYKGDVALNCDSEGIVALDHCVYDLRIQNRNAVERYLRECPPPPESDDALLLRVMAQAHFSIFEVLECKPGVGVQFLDCMTEKEVFVCDLNFSRTARPGSLLAARLLRFPDVNLFSGASLPADPDILDDAIEFRDAAVRTNPGVDLDPTWRSQFATRILRHCIREGLAELIYYR